MVEYSQFNSATENGMMPLPHHWSVAAKDVLNERARQINNEKWTAAHDDNYVMSELAFAGAAYAVASVNHGEGGSVTMVSWTQRLWPFSLAWLKPKDPRRDLVRAAALIIAEIERIDRKTSQESKGA